VRRLRASGRPPSLSLSWSPRSPTSFLATVGLRSTHSVLSAPAGDCAVPLQGAALGAAAADLDKVGSLRRRGLPEVVRSCGVGRGGASDGKGKGDEAPSREESGKGATEASSKRPTSGASPCLSTRTTTLTHPSTLSTRRAPLRTRCPSPPTLEDTPGCRRGRRRRGEGPCRPSTRGTRRGGCRRCGRRRR
jgi:hypothetical protein